MIGTIQESPRLKGEQWRPQRRSLAALLAPLRELAQTSAHCLTNSLGNFRCDEEQYSLARFLFDGPSSGGDPIRLGIFAGIHGDEPAGSLAVVRFLRDLVKSPELAAGYRIYAYPVCNPTGFEDNTRHTRGGKDLNREFWRASEEPEVYILEEELWTHAFQGIIALHSDDTSEGLYGFVNGPDLSKDLLEPALWAAEKYLHRNTRLMIDGFRAKRGLIDGGYAGILSSSPEVKPVPFQLTFETPAHAPLHLQIEAHAAALRCILAEYRTIMAIAPNI